MSPCQISSWGSSRGDSKQYLDLPAWREAHGWDKNGALADMQIDFDPDRLELTIGSSQPFPQASASIILKTTCSAMSPEKPGPRAH